MGENYSALSDIVELYTVRYDPQPGGYAPLRFTTYYKQITLGGNLYYAAPVDRSGVSYTDSLELMKMNFSLPADNASCVDIVAKMAMVKAYCRVERWYSLGIGQEAVLIDGPISAAQHNGGIVNFEISSIMGDLSKTIPRIRLQNLCNHTLFDSGCGLSAETYRVSDSNFSRQLSGYRYDNASTFSMPERYFTSGKAYCTTTGEWRYITKHEIVGGVMRIYISHPFSSNAATLALDIYPGCNKTPDQTYDGVTHLLIGCLNCCGLAKDDGNIDRGFDNIENFLGFPYIPTKNSTESTVTLEG